MHSKMIAKKIIDFNKAAFDNTFDAIAVLQYHSEKMMMIFCEKANFFPPEGKRVITEWMEAYKKGKEDFQKSVEDSFNTVESFFADSGDAAGFSTYTMKGKKDQSAKEAIDSFQTKAVVADSNMKQNTVAKKKATGLAKTVRKSFKPLNK